MGDNEHDAILSQLRHLNLVNHPSDRVKIIYHPEKVSKTVPILDFDQHELAKGTNLGVFPSYYEPWSADFFFPSSCVQHCKHGSF
jgi:glycogen(starch) synthase